MKIVGTRVKKAEFSNDLSVVEDFRINPRIDFNYSRLTGDAIPAGLRYYAINASVTIEGTNENPSPIRVNVLTETRIEIEDGKDDEIHQQITSVGINLAYEYAKSVLAALTLVAGVRPIALPDFDKLQSNQNEAN